jgi:pSer/pThr/pTyr-binding forkhead associated (FHA) protein
VVGWFVVKHGPEKGKDYRIRSENNTIGRDDDMNISIKDNMVSRQRHAYVIFEPQTNRFFIKPGDARGLVHRNGNVVLQPEELHAYDEILLGKTTLVFVPLCGEHFKWE